MMLHRTHSQSLHVTACSGSGKGGFALLNIP